MLVGVVGLGLIGGSFAKAYSKTGHTVLAYDANGSVVKYAELSGDVEGELTEDRLGDCDLILICTYPEGAIKYMKKEGPFFGTKPVVMDCCGTKEVIAGEGMKTAARYGFTYVSAHPMAGTQFSGFKHARENLFKGAPMVIVPPKFDDISFLEKVKKILMPAGFRSVSFTTAEEHDKLIAYTSQLAHVASNAYVKSPSARSHSGFSAGSYKDMTRVARLNPDMWTELFMENRANLINELDIYIRHLGEYRKALADADADELRKLLSDGDRIKKEIDG